MESALKSDDSLFTPGAAIWSKDLLGDLREYAAPEPPLAAHADYV